MASREVKHEVLCGLGERPRHRDPCNSAASTMGVGIAVASLGILIMLVACLAPSGP